MTLVFGCAHTVSSRAVQITVDEIIEGMSICEVEVYDSEGSDLPSFNELKARKGLPHGSCHDIPFRKGTFEEAETYCESHSGELASVELGELQDFIELYMPYHGLFGNLWVKDVPADVQNSESQGRRDCKILRFDRGYIWSRQPCSEEAYFLCKYDISPECYKDRNALDYRGFVDKSVSDEPCGLWDKDINLHEGEIPKHNYCRSRDGDVTCYLVNTNHRIKCDIGYPGEFCPSVTEVERLGFWPLDGKHGLEGRLTGETNNGYSHNTLILKPALGVLDGAFLFKGTNDSFIHINLNKELDTIYSITVLLSVYPAGTKGYIFGYVSGQDQKMELSHIGDILHLRIAGRHGEEPLSVEVGGLQLNKWNQIGFCSDYHNGEIRFYHNGMEILNTVIRDFELATNAQTILLGASESQTTVPFTGMMHCLQIFNEALNKEEVREAFRDCEGNSKTIL
ncbi:uncharacterized protein [Ptychodera flava]|uniref:uncharacterized protein n=1 Tax=Ptychodera flava TaxID=63121 RepID=UPI00396A1A47